MNYIKIKALPTKESILQSYPLSEKGYASIAQHRAEIKAIIEGRDPRLLMIIGPCSAWPMEAVLDYARLLKSLEVELRHALKIVMRMYIQKPRTTKGWTGPVNQPNPFQPADIEKGMYYAHKMMVDVAEMGLPIADECLFTHNTQVFSDFVSWFAIGARSSEDHEHRIFASAASCPVGMKNPTHGSLDIAVNSVVAAQNAHFAAIDRFAVQTQGNPHAHLVLRGSNASPNYSLQHVEEVKRYMDAHGIVNPAIVIDVSHDNCFLHGKKDPTVQPETIFSVMQYLDTRPDLAKLVKGFMVESYIKEGNQKLEAHTAETIDLGGLSITDPCLSWKDTACMLRELASRRG